MTDGVPQTEIIIVGPADEELCRVPGYVVSGHLIAMQFSCYCGQAMDIPVDSSATCGGCGRMWYVTQGGALVTDSPGNEAA